MRRHLPEWLVAIRTRFLLVHLLLVAVPIAGIGFARFYERDMLRALEDDMVHQGKVLAAALEGDPEGLRLADREELLRAIARETRLRVRLLDAAGHLVADSHREGPPEGEEPPAPHVLGSLTGLDVRRSAYSHERVVPSPDFLLARSEVQQALRGHYGAATRLYRHADRVYLFSALPILQQGVPQGVVYLTRSTNPVRLEMYHLRSSLLRIFGVTLLVTLVISLILAATISRPLTHLTRVASAIAAGDRSRPLQLDRSDEIGQLARAFQAMLERLDGRARDVAELAANLSHEFKSPLTSMRGAAELLLDGAADDPQARERFLRNMLSDAQRLDRLVTRLLELSRLEADPAPDELLDLEALVREASSRGPGVPVQVTNLAAHRTVRGKRAHLVSAVGNLVDNARHFAAPGSKVDVVLRDAAPGRVEVSVHNDGEPISPANLQRIWDRFFTTRGDAGGSGLGLPIVLSVARAHGGGVRVDSRKDRGTTFWLDLPVTEG